MKNLEWSNKYSIQIDSVDEQHKQPIIIINDLYDIVQKKAIEQKIILILQKLMTYTIKHFKYEENLFDELGYEFSVEHKAEHEEFVNKITEYLDQVTTDNKKISPDLLSYLFNWLVNHILKSDKKYIPLFKLNNIN